MNCAKHMVATNSNRRTECFVESMMDMYHDVKKQVLQINDAFAGCCIYKYHCT